MLLRKKKENFSRKKDAVRGADSEENLQSFRSWVRKIEQTTASVSSRLSAVEKRLSGGMMNADTSSKCSLDGPIQRLFSTGKKKNTPDVARVLDSELVLLHNELVKQQQETNCLKEHLGEMQEKHTRITTELETMQTVVAGLHTAMDLQKNKTERQEPFVMHFGSLEIPVEFTGIIGGLLAFVIAILVLIDQKEVLLSPWFLIPVGFLLIGFAFFKMLRLRSRTSLYPCLPHPLNKPPAQLTLAAYERKEG